MVPPWMDWSLCEFALDTRKGELLLGFSLRAGLWIDGLQILTSLGRKSEWYGNPNGGSGYVWIILITIAS